MKSEKKEHPGNYSLIRLMSGPSKIVESVFLETVLRHMENKELTDDSQHGFSKGKLYLTNLVAFFYRVTALVDKGRATDVIHPDLCKASDTISYVILLSEL